MAEKTSLRDYQRTLSARLVNAAASQSASKLGIQAGDHRWLIDLSDTSEVIPAPSVYPVPLTRSWFLGVTNIRGNLYSVVDFRAFSEGVATTITEDSRLLLVADKYRIYCGLLVDRVLGLYRDEQLSVDNDAVTLPWATTQFVDHQSQRWKHLATQQLVTHPDFLQVGV
jgi:twitching motility protein PilI